MKQYKDYFNSLKDYKMIDEIYGYLIDLIHEEIKDKENKDQYLSIFLIYFALLSDGNTCISLDKDILSKKFKSKLDSQRILLQEEDEYNEEIFNEFYNYSLSLINDYLDQINESSLKEVIGGRKFFLIDNNYLYLTKYEVSRLSIKESINRLFNYEDNKDIKFDYKKNCINFALNDKQDKAASIGVNKNLIITGGPGTGKTTSILFLLLNILSVNNDYEIYLAAPSGIAADRMKDSIFSGLNHLTEEYKTTNIDIVNHISSLSSSTIHSLLGHDFTNDGFKYNKDNQFAVNSIFVIDESSMIDINIFDSLLQAIPTGARVFLMGDKNQLPSVECGAVFNDLIKHPLFKDKIIELDVSNRFSNNTYIYKLAESINAGTNLPVKEVDFKDINEFKIYEDSTNCPIYYYQTPININEKNQINKMLDIWGDRYIKPLNLLATSLNPTDISLLDNLFKKIEEAKILCAQKETFRGVKYINSYMVKHYIDRTRLSSVDKYYPGQLIIITKNNKQLDLSNGDKGILVTFKDDKTLYLMLKKSSSLVVNTTKDDNRIFKLGDYIFYPLRMLPLNDLDYAYAITIHKSQGSDYKNILVILPKTKGHPLVNRQIVYTAITRTKGVTYILSSLDILNDAKDNIIIRDTNID